MITWQKLREIKDHIDSLLGVETSLEGWLWRVHGVPVNFNNIKYRNKMQATRHAWVDSMIKEFQAKGD